MPLERAIREIRSELEAIERDDTLDEEAGFGSRLEALDVIEVSILERVEGLLAGSSQEEALLALKQRAEAVQEPAGSNRREAVSPTACRHQVWRLSRHGAKAPA